MKNKRVYKYLFGKSFNWWAFWFAVECIIAYLALAGLTFFIAWCLSKA